MAFATYFHENRNIFLYIFQIELKNVPAAGFAAGTASRILTIFWFLSGQARLCRPRQHRGAGTHR